MKTVISIVLLSLSTVVLSQTFGEPGDEWHNSYVMHVGPSGPGQGTSHHMEATMFKYVGDTTVGIEDFQLIVKCQKRWGIGYHGFPAEYENDSIYVIQDSLQVFYGTPGNMKLIYDFNLQVGDSTLIHTGWYVTDSQYVHVTQTDSLEIDGSWRKRIVFEDINSWHQGMRWIEGVGDELYGVLRDPIGVDFDLHYHFLMKHENVSLIGDGIVQYICEDDLMHVEANKITQLLVYPNPVLDFATVLYSGGSSDYLLSVYDLNGNLVLSQIAKSEKQMVDLSGLTNGLYFLQINDAEGVYTSKIVKR